MTKFHKDGTLPLNGEIFVFGSNLAGIHGAGAAKIAHQKFGAVYGRGLGFQGRSYAIPTKDYDIRTISLDEIKHYVKIFVDRTNDDFIINHGYFVTRVGCGLAGYTDDQIAPLFKGARNCSFVEAWRPYLEDAQVPLVKKKLPLPEFPVDDQSLTCSKCGMVWKGAMMYSCGDNECPVQRRAYC